MTPRERLELRRQIAGQIETLVRAYFDHMAPLPTLTTEGDVDELDSENVMLDSFTVLAGGDWQRGARLTFNAIGKLVRVEHILED